MTEYVHVVTSLEMGWDCVCGVYRSEESAIRSCFHDDEERSLDEMRELVEDGSLMYVIHTKKLEY
jgi:hypothetical protein